MHVLSIMPVADIVLAGPNRVDPGLPQSNLPNFVEEWKRPGKRTTWPQFFKSLPANYQDKARQDWYGYQQEIASRRKSVDPGDADLAVTPGPNLGGPEGEQGAFPFVQPGVTPQDFLTRLRTGVQQFGKAFNEQTIRPYNNAIQHALRSIQALSQLPEIPPETEQAGEELLKKFQEIQAGDAEDAQLVQQLGQLAQGLASAAGYAPGAASNVQTRVPASAAPAPAAQPGMAEQVGRGVGQVAKAPGRALDWAKNQVGRGVDWARQQGAGFGRGYSGAESNHPILTAQMGSASEFICSWQENPFPCGRG